MTRERSRIFGADARTRGEPRLMIARPEIVLAPAASASREARRWVQSQMSEWGLDELADTVALLASEIVTNALIHAGTPIRLRMVQAGPGVRVEVQDGSVVPPIRRRYSATATTGRGLQLLEHLADTWGWAPHIDGKTVWFEVLTAREDPATAQLSVGDISA